MRARRRRPVDAAVVEGRRPRRRCSPTRRRRCATTCCSRTTPRTPTEINHTRYAIRGFFDGQTKYARYYGVGGGKPGTGLWGKDPGRKLYDVDAAFADQEHEWYDLDEDPHEMVNLAHDRGRRAELRANYERLLEYEAAEFACELREYTGYAGESRRFGQSVLRMYSLIV